MIIKELMMMIKRLLGVLLMFSLPSLPASLVTAFNEFVGMMLKGVSVLRVFIGNDAMNVLGVCLSLIIAIETLMKIWQFVWWVLSKIPMLNLKG